MFDESIIDSFLVVDSVPTDLFEELSSKLQEISVIV